MYMNIKNRFIFLSLILVAETGLLWRFGQIWGELLHEVEGVLVLFLCLPHQVVQEGDPRLVGPRVHQLIQGVDAEPHGIASVTTLYKDYMV